MYVFRKDDHYCSEVYTRARQLASSLSTTEPVRPVDLKYCIDVDFLELTVALDFIENADSNDALTNVEVYTFLTYRA